MTHDYKRHGTLSPYAALYILDGTVIGECTERHRHQEFLRFLGRLDREFLNSLALHVVLDNSCGRSADSTNMAFIWRSTVPETLVHPQDH
jgi:hypothetical protein